ncbi:hypothetical protein AURDEDRAFT_173942 [Auricularia subglabra TFB-10046 SS5]|uniref:Mid2 domain-containing protein n=1 Tax=Auricularia subglabra (strain TFB-10046 / SS5) TaxID=717982 RepID=J0CZD4_AURST|nr:hypothetical protein AURDEDRAFT_173942 [Auricularia subglabra TFB-10046 SS5]
MVPPPSWRLLWATSLLMTRIRRASSAVLEIPASDWQLSQPYDLFTYHPQFLTGADCDLSLDVVRLGYGGRASVTFPSSEVYLQIVEVTNPLPVSITLSQGSTILRSDLWVSPSRSDHGVADICTRDLFSFTDFLLSSSERAHIEIIASTRDLLGDLPPGDPPVFVFRGLETILTRVPQPTNSTSSPPPPPLTVSFPPAPLPTSSSNISTTSGLTHGTTLTTDGSPGGFPSSSPAPPNRGSAVPSIAGAAVGAAIGALAVILAAIAIYVVRRRKARRKGAMDHEGPVTMPPSFQPQLQPGSTNVVFDPMSMIDRSPSGKVTTMSAGLTARSYGASTSDDAVSAALVEYRASDNSSTAAWHFQQLYQYFDFEPRVYAIVGGCATVLVVGLGYGGKASITFTGSGVFLQTVSTTSGLPAFARLSQGGRTVAYRDELRNDAGQPTCRSDLFSYTDLDPSQPSLLEVTATTEYQIGVPPFFMIQGIQVIVPNATFTESSTQPGPTASSGPSHSEARETQSGGAPSQTSQQTPSGSSNVPVIAGAAVGGAAGALAVILAGIAVLLYRRRRARRQTGPAIMYTAASMPAQAPSATFERASMIDRSPSGKVTTMSAGFTSPWTGLTSPALTTAGSSEARTSMFSSGSFSSAPLDPAGRSSLLRVGTLGVAPPAYGDVVHPVPPVAPQKLD